MECNPDKRARTASQPDTQPGDRPHNQARPQALGWVVQPAMRCRTLILQPTQGAWLEDLIKRFLTLEEEHLNYDTAADDVHTQDTSTNV